MTSTPYQPSSTVYLNALTDDKFGVLGTTPVAKQGGAACATLSLGTITNTSPYGFASKADGDALVAQVKDITAALVAYGMIKQS